MVSHSLKLTHTLNDPNEAIHLPASILCPVGPIGLVTLLVAKSMGASQVLISGKVLVLINCATFIIKCVFVSQSRVEYKFSMIRCIL